MNNYMDDNSKICCDELREAKDDDRFDFYNWPPSIVCDDWSIQMEYCIFCGKKL